MTAPYYSDAHVTLHHGDCVEVMAALTDASVDAIVTDPPYGLGFMGKAWDDLPPGLPWARECLRVLKPGGHLIAFGGTRTWHRLAVAVEDAGFEMRDSIAWLYGSGFPKSLDVSKAIEARELRSDQLKLTDEEHRFCHWMYVSSGLSLPDARRLFGSDRFITGKVELVNTSTKENPRIARRSMVPTAAAWEAARPFLPEYIPTWVEALVKDPPKPPLQTPSEWKGGKGEGTRGGTTEAAAQWQGWGTALKPAFEPIVVARKPLKGNVAANVLEYGTGALNVDGCRIGTEERTNNAGGASSLQRVSRVEHGYRPTVGEWTNEPTTVSGRWPANVVLDEDQAAALDEQSGESVSNVRRPTGRDTRGIPNGSTPVVRINDTEQRGVSDSGGASRFFYVARNEDSCDCSDAGTSTHGELLDTAVPVGTPLSASDVDIERLGSRFTYTAKASTDERLTHNGVAHPTVKPLSLMRWLVRLVTPPGGTVLEPFAGSGTTVEACILEGFRCIAIEREADYLPLITQRIHRRRDPVEYLTAAGEDLGLFGEPA